MHLLIHDVDRIDIKNTDTVVIADNGAIRPCICCFGCWIKTPGRCVINDGYHHMGALFAQCDQLIIISRCYYGAYSPFVKNVLDRSVCPYQLPYFTTQNGETRHPKRYTNNIALSVHFYGDITEDEKETAIKLVDKMHFYQRNVSFYRSYKEIQGI